MPAIDRSSKKKNRQENVRNESHITTNGLNTFRIFHPRAADYTFFSSECEKFYRIDQMIGHKTNLSKIKIEIIQTTFSDHNGMKLKIKTKEK